jgi:hypothetical protein
VAFATALRLDGFATAEVHETRVELILRMLCLERIAEFRVGGRQVGDGGRVLTDGEMKRLSIACEIVSLPTLILADEPTTGLDSPTAYDVMRSVTSLAKEIELDDDSSPTLERSTEVPSQTHSEEEDEEADESSSLSILRTVIVTVHQPSVEILSLFSKVLVLAEGRLVYFGAVSELVPYFSSPGLNYIFEEGSNPADFAVLIAGGGLVAEGQEQPSPSDALAKAFLQSEACLALPSKSATCPSSGGGTLNQLLGIPGSSFPPMEVQFNLLLRRAWLSTSRRVDVISTQLTKAVVVGLLTGLVYHQVFDKTNVKDAWMNVFDEACSLGNGDEHRCLVDIPTVSSVGVSCEYDSNNMRCLGSAVGAFRGPWITNKVVVAAVCSLAPVLIPSNNATESAMSSACAQLNQLTRGVREQACVLAPSTSPLGACVANSHLGSRLSPASLNASSIFFLAVGHTCCVLVFAYLLIQHTSTLKLRTGIIPNHG